MNDTFYKSVPTYKGMCKKAEQILNNKKIENLYIGKTVLGRNIPAFSIGAKQGAVLYVGGFHSTEWLTVLTLFKLLEDISQTYVNNENLAGIDIIESIETKGIIIVPCINIDGQELIANGFKSAGDFKKEVEKISKCDLSRWNANIRGVDINHNFDAGYELVKEMEIKNGITEPAPRQYGGTCAESEPETQALVKLCKQYDISRVIAFHSQGEEIFYHYGENTPPHSKTLAQIFATSSGYEVLEPTGMASHGGFKDWFIEKMCKPGFTLELGKGENPLPVEQFPEIYDKILEMMVLGIVL